MWSLSLVYGLVSVAGVAASSVAVVALCALTHLPISSGEGPYCSDRLTNVLPSRRASITRSCFSSGLHLRRRGLLGLVPVVTVWASAWLHGALGPSKAQVGHTERRRRRSWPE